MNLPYWLDNEAWDRIWPLLPDGRSGARRIDDRRIISGILYVRIAGLRWQDCPRAYGPWSTVYNRYRRWSLKGIWQPIEKTIVDFSRTPLMHLK